MKSLLKLTILKIVVGGDAENVELLSRLKLLSGEGRGGEGQ